MTQRPTQECREGDYLTLDVEQDLVRLLKAEIRFYRERESQRQVLASQADFSLEQAYKQVDDSAIGFIDFKSLEGFFKRA